MKKENILIACVAVLFVILIGVSAFDLSESVNRRNKNTELIGKSIIIDKDTFVIMDYLHKAVEGSSVFILSNRLEIRERSIFKFKIINQ